MDRRHAVLGAVTAWQLMRPITPLHAQAASPQPAASAPLSATEPLPSAAADVPIIGRLLRELHPGVYRYQTPAQLEAGLQRLEQAFAAGSNLRHRYLALSQFLMPLRCGHSYANFYNQRRALGQALFSQHSRLPFAFTWLGGDADAGAAQMVVTADHSGSGAIPRGAVVERINGLNPSDMLKALLPYTRVDGHVLPKQIHLLSVRGNIQLEYFDIFHGLLYGEPSGGVHRLVLRLPDGRQVQAEHAALSPQQRAAFLPKSVSDRDAVQWLWRMEQGAAVLTMPGWALYNSRWDWKTWLHARLDELAADTAARGLIVDLRDNEGGLDCGDQILARYTHKPLAFSEFRRCVRFRQIPSELNPILDTWDDSFRKIGENASELTADAHHAGGVSLLELGSRNQRIEPRGPRLTVPLRVLTSAQNSSATFGFASRMRAAGLGKTVGQTTGGNQRGINGGAFFFVRLPSSGLSFDLPLIGYYPYEAQPDGGLPPDIAAAPSLAAIASGQDLVMQAALNSL